MRPTRCGPSSPSRDELQEVMRQLRERDCERFHRSRRVPRLRAPFARRVHGREGSERVLAKWLVQRAERPVPGGAGRPVITEETGFSHSLPSGAPAGHGRSGRRVSIEALSRQPMGHSGSLRCGIRRGLTRQSYSTISGRSRRGSILTTGVWRPPS